MKLRNVFIAACLLGSAATASANVPVTFPTGSIIIPTGGAFQDDCGAVSVYGLVYDVLRANAWLAANNYHTITIYYAYSDTKASPNRCIPTSLDPGPAAPTNSAMWNDGCDITGVSAQLLDNTNASGTGSTITTYQTAPIVTSGTTYKCVGGSVDGNSCTTAATSSTECSATWPCSGSSGNKKCNGGPNNGNSCTNVSQCGTTLYTCTGYPTTTTSGGKSNVYPGFSTRVASTGITLNYLGGPFIISAGISGTGGTDVDVFRKLIAGTINAQDSDGNTVDFSAFRTRNSSQQSAPTSACSFGTDHYVNMHIATSSFNASIGKGFQTAPPRIALLVSDTNTHTGTVDDGILEGYLKNAGLDFNGAGGCPAATANTANCPSVTSLKCVGGPNASAGCASSADCGTSLTSYPCNKAGTSGTCGSGHTCCNGGGHNNSRCDNQAASYCGSTTTTYSCTSSSSSVIESGQIYDAFDFDDLATDLTTTKYTMLWTPHWQTKSTLSTQEVAAFTKIKGFLTNQTGLAAECASISSFEGASFAGGPSSGSEGTNGNAMQLQTCGGTGSTCTGTVTQGVSGNPTAPYGTPGLGTHALFNNCSNPDMTTGTGCVYFPYPGDSFAQIGDFLWDANGGWVTGYLPQSSAASIYTKSVVPLISITTLTSGNKSFLAAAPTAYDATNFLRSTTNLATRTLTGTNALVADLATRSINKDTAGYANVLYLGGHNQTAATYGVAGSKMMLETLLQLGISTLPPQNSETEVARNSPIVATVGNNVAVVQGTYELVTPAPTITTYSANGASSTFKFPAIKGHMRARTASTISTTASTFGSSGILFDAATQIPDPTASGCSAWFTASCRTVFTTLTTGAAPTIHYLTTLEVGTGTVGAAMGTNTAGTVDLDTGNQSSLIQRVLAGDDSLVTGLYKPALGGVDRSTVAVIGSSALVNATRPTMAYFGADDGMMHAVCASTGGACDVLGRELWAYIPRTELPLERYNSGRIDGSPRVFDAFVNNGAGARAWRTVLVFQTGTGDTTFNTRVPAVYALDVSDPTAPKVLWDYAMSDVGARANFELGQGLTVAEGQVQTGTLPTFMVYAQTNNGGVLTPGNVVTAINVDTGAKTWQNGYQFTTSLRSGGATVPSTTGMPGGAVGVDKTQQGYITDLVYGTLYGDLWEVDPATGVSRYAPGTLPAAGNPLLRFSTDMHSIGATPAIYSLSGGGVMYAAFATGGYTDSYPNDTTWTTTATTQYAMGVNLSPTTPAPTINENAGTNGTTTSDIPIKFPLGAGQVGYAQVSVIDGQLYVTSDTADVNSATYGTSTTATGLVSSLSVASTTGLASTTVVIQGGADSVVASGTTVYSGASSDQQQLAAAATGTGNAVETTAATKMTRRLWLRTQ